MTRIYILIIYRWLIVFEFQLFYFNTIMLFKTLVVCTHFRRLVRQNGSNASAQRQQMALVIHFDTNPTHFSAFILINKSYIRFFVDIFCSDFHFIFAQYIGTLLPLILLLY